MLIPEYQTNLLLLFHLFQGGKTIFLVVPQNGEFRSVDLAEHCLDRVSNVVIITAVNDLKA